MMSGLDFLFILAALTAVSQEYDFKEDTNPYLKVDVESTAGELEAFGFPYTNNRKLLTVLNNVAAAQRPKFALVLVGPKSSGKSMAIQFMIPEWTRLGYTVIDIDLKGELDKVRAENVMSSIPKKLEELLSGLSTTEYKCVHSSVFQECPGVLTRKLSDSVEAINKIWDICACFGLMVIVGYVTKSVTFIRKKLPQWCLLLLFIVIFTFIVITRFRDLIVNETQKLMVPLNSTIASGNWKTLVCTCNVISRCSPEHRPILIVREFANFDPNDLRSLFRPIERMKQGDVAFPIILETSDFLWFREPPVQKSSDSFKAYYLEEMSFDEGVKETVEKFKMWSLEEFTKIYDAIGGHLGSYALMWDEIKYKSLSVNDSIANLKQQSYDNLISCVRHTIDNIEAVTSFLAELKQNNYVLKLSHIPREVWALLKCNILFSRGALVYPQNRLLQHAISAFLRDFSGN